MVTYVNIELNMN